MLLNGLKNVVKKKKTNNTTVLSSNLLTNIYMCKTWLIID